MLSKQELHNLTEKELRTEVDKAKLIYNQLEIDSNSGNKQSKKSDTLKKYKIYIARILTILRQKQFRELKPT